MDTHTVSATYRSICKMPVLTYPTELDDDVRGLFEELTPDPPELPGATQKDAPDKDFDYAAYWTQERTDFWSQSSSIESWIHKYIPFIHEAKDLCVMIDELQPFNSLPLNERY